MLFYVAPPRQQMERSITCLRLGIKLRVSFNGLFIKAQM